MPRATRIRPGHGVGPATGSLRRGGPSRSVPSAAATASDPALPGGLDRVELPPDAVEVGRIGEAWGVQGWFKVHAHSTAPQALFSCRRWLLQPPTRGARRFSGTALLRVRECREHGDLLVVRADGVTDRSQAEALRGARVFVPRSSFPTPADGEYYWVDLLGLAVFNREGLPLGTVADLMSTGPQTVLVLRDDAVNPPAERLIPFVDAYVDAVDLVGRRITVDWQPDYS